MRLTIGIFKYLLIDRLTLSCFGGGSSGSSGGNDALWNAQADAAKQSSAMSGEMFDYWRKYSPGYLGNANTMVNEAMDGTLTDRARATAGADADQATAQGLAAADRSLDRYGATLNPNAMAHDAKSAALAGAANKAGAMSKATEWGENQKWARNQDAFGMTSGMPGNAVASANSASNSLNSMAAMQNNSNSAAAQSAAGYGVAGATIASKIFKADGGLIQAKSLKLKCGGAVRRADGGAVHLANGGMPQSPVVGWRDRVAAMPTIGRVDNSNNPLTSFVGGAMPTVAAEIAKPYLKEAGSAVKSWGKDLFSTRAVPETDMMMPSNAMDGYNAAAQADAALVGESSVEGADAAAKALTEGAQTATTAADSAALADAALVGESSVAGANAAAAGLATETATATALGATEAVAAANAWNPVGWVMGGLALASALSNRKADGGSMARVDMTPGGAVEGPGSETSDSIPAWVSNQEYVLNAEAVKLAGKDRLDALNEQGLKVRYGNGARMVNGEAKPNGLFDGGMLGLAMGAGAATYNQLDQQNSRLKLAEEEMQLRRDSNAREAERQGLAMQNANLELAQKKRLEGDETEMRAVGNKPPTTLVAAVNKAGGMPAYISSANAAADPENPLSDEAQKTISAQYKAESTITPVTQLQDAITRSNIMARTNPSGAQTFMNSAMQVFGGHMISAVKEKNGAAILAGYNAIPNGHSLKKVDFVGKNVVTEDENGVVQSVPENDFIGAIYSKINPDKALSLEAMAAKAEQTAAIHKLQIEQRERHIEMLRDGKRFGGGSGKGKGDDAPEVPEVGGAISIDSVNKYKNFYDGGKDEAGAPIYKATVAPGRQGTFAWDEMLGVANQIKDYSAKDKVFLSDTEAIQTAAQVMASRSARAAILSEISGAKDEKQKAALTLEMASLPQVAYRFGKNDSIEQVFQSGGINAPTKVVGKINPHSSFDLSKDPALQTVIAERFERDPLWAEYAKRMNSDAARGKTPEETAALFQESHKAAADQMVADAISGAEDTGMSPLQQKQAGQFAAQKAQIMGRYYQAYRPIAEADDQRARATVKRSEERGQRPYLANSAPGAPWPVATKPATDLNAGARGMATAVKRNIDPYSIAEDAHRLWR
jgi:hypothetical protein